MSIIEWMKMEAARSYEEERQGPGQRPAQSHFGEGCADWGLFFFWGGLCADDGTGTAAGVGVLRRMEQGCAGSGSRRRRSRAARTGRLDGDGEAAGCEGMTLGEGEVGPEARKK